MGSKPYRLDQKDFSEIFKVMAVAGVSAALVAGLQFISQFNLGVFGPLLTAGMTALIKAVQQWAADNSQPETR
jgi:hypothetical protein